MSPEVRGLGVGKRLLGELEIQARAMHSFKAAHKELNWKVIVAGLAEGWPRYERAFPVIVYPGNGESDP